MAVGWPRVVELVAESLSPCDAQTVFGLAGPFTEVGAVAGNGPSVSGSYFQGHDYGQGKDVHGVSVVVGPGVRGSAFGLETNTDVYRSLVGAHP
jgi:hypothetical protein